MTEKIHFNYLLSDPLDYNTFYKDEKYNSIRRCKLLLFGQCLGKNESILSSLDYIVSNNKKRKTVKKLSIFNTNITDIILDYLYASKKRIDLVKNLEIGCINRAISQSKKFNIRCIWNNSAFVDLYNEICYKLAVNLDVDSPVKSDYLIKMLLNNSIEATDAANLSSRDMCPKLVEKIENRISLRTNLERKIKYSELYRCKKCKRNQCTTERLYNRGLDEGVSLMISCGYCGNSWCD